MNTANELRSYDEEIHLGHYIFDERCHDRYSGDTDLLGQFSIRLDEKKFDESVYTSLKNVVARLEKDEQDFGDALDFIGGTKLGKPPSAMGSVLQPGWPGLGITDTSDLQQAIKILGAYDPWRRKMLYAEMMYRERRIDPPALINRLKPSKIDAYLKQELKDRGINLNYDYGVFDNAKKEFVILNGNFTVQVGEGGMTSHNTTSPGLYTTIYNVALFPTETGSPGSLNIFFPEKTRWLWASAWPLLTSSLLFMAIIILSFSYTIYVIFRQKKLSRMKTDFINNMTHEFKTPIATISLAADSITTPMVIDNSSKVERFAGIIKQENKRMLNQVEKVLQMALIDKDEFKLQLTTVDIHEIIRRAAEHMKLQLEQRGGTLTTDLTAETYEISGDQTHISNMIHNLLDNANKYTPENPNISIHTKNESSGISITVTDNGIGLSKEAKKHVFDRFYRVTTGNIHDVKGFGLGLSYVKAMMMAHNGTVDVRSELGKGSSFILFFPLAQQGE